MAGKVVVVTGASSGIGEATAKLFAARGAHVVLLARNRERLETAAAAIRSAGGKATAYALDLADAGAVAETARRITAEAGAPEVVANIAGAGRWAPLLDTTPEEARAMIEAPYLAAVYLTRALLPDMVARGRGQIACISSPASYLAWPNACAYIAARHAVKGFTDALRMELRGTGVGVSLVVLGTVDSPYWRHNPGSRKHLLQPPLPGLMPTLSVEDAAAAIVSGVERKARRVVKPGLFRALFLLNALAPGLVESQLRAAAKRALKSGSA